MSERILDYRSEDIPPESCTVCGAPIVKREKRGTVYISGPADREFAAKYGVTGDGEATTVYWTWWCSVDDTHEWGPVLLG